MSAVGNQILEEPSAQEQLSYLWDVYKYRHGLCWKAVYKIIAGVLVLAVLPYAKPELIKPAWDWMVLAPPVIGTLLAAYGVFVVNNELRLFSQVKVAHHVLQKQFLESVLKENDVRKKAVDDLNPKRARWTLFDIYVHLLMLILFLLSLGNTLFLKLSWIPRHAV
jgi:hypothetical protein